MKDPAGPGNLKCILNKSFVKINLSRRKEKSSSKKEKKAKVSSDSLAFSASLFSKFYVRPVAKRSISGFFALAEGDLLFFFNVERHGGEPRSLVGPVAERLCLGQAAPAPVIGSGFQRHDLGVFCGNLGKLHDVSSQEV